MVNLREPGAPAGRGGPALLLKWTVACKGPREGAASLSPPCATKSHEACSLAQPDPTFRAVVTALGVGGWPGTGQGPVLWPSAGFGWGVPARRDGQVSGGIKWIACCPRGGSAAERPRAAGLGELQGLRAAPSAWEPWRFFLNVCHQNVDPFYHSLYSYCEKKLQAWN